MLAASLISEGTLSFFGKGSLQALSVVCPFLLQ